MNATPETAYRYTRPEARMNPHKLAARCRKLSRILVVIDAQSMRAGLSLTADAELIAQGIADASPEFWTEVSAAAGVNAPSQESVLALVVFLRDRAKPLPSWVARGSLRDVGRYEAARLGGIVAELESGLKPESPLPF